MGYRIELGEIEAAAMGVGNVDRVCCIYNEKKHIIIMLYEGNIIENDVSAELKRRVPDYMLPSRIVKLDVMPVNANGKIDRKLLHETYGE